MKPSAKSFLKSGFALAILGAGIWLIATETRGLFRNNSVNRVWFYDESEKKLYTMPDTVMPPDKGIGGLKGDGERAIVVGFGKDRHDRSNRRIAYLQKYTPELKKLLDERILARAAKQVFNGKIPGLQSEYFQTNTLVKRVDDADWHTASSPEGRTIVNEWRSWHDANGNGPYVCAAD